MKKVRVTLKDGCPGRKLYLFPTPEALYLWATGLERNEPVEVGHIEELLLEPGDFIEAELRGYVYMYEHPIDLKHKRLDLVRLGKVSRAENATEAVTIHEGWVTGTLLPLKNYSDDYVNVTPLIDDAGKLDLPVLFNDDIPPVTDE